MEPPPESRVDTPVERTAPPEPTPPDAVAPTETAVAAAIRVEGYTEAVMESSLIRALRRDESGVFATDDDGYQVVAEHLANLEVTPEMHGIGPTLRVRAAPGIGDRAVGTIGTASGGPQASVATVGTATPRGNAALNPLSLASLDPDDPNDAALIRDTVRRGSLGIQDCYTQRLKLSPGLQSRLVVQFDITLGKVLGVKITTSETVDSKLEESVKRCVRGWRFDRTVTATMVELPFALVPSG